MYPLKKSKYNFFGADFSFKSNIFWGPEQSEKASVQSEKTVYNNMECASIFCITKNHSTLLRAHTKVTTYQNSTEPYNVYTYNTVQVVQYTYIV